MDLLRNNKESSYNNDINFNRAVHKVLEFTCNKSLADKVFFACKTGDSSLLPNLDGDTMNCSGSVTVAGVVDYLCNDDQLFKYIKGAPPPNKKKNPDDSNSLVELRLRTNHKKSDGSIYEICLEPNLALDHVRKYLFSFIDLKGEEKYMPLYYCLKDPSRSLLTQK